jgi:hypothetical protein
VTYFHFHMLICHVLISLGQVSVQWSSAYFFNLVHFIVEV